MEKDTMCVHGKLVQTEEVCNTWRLRERSVGILIHLDWRSAQDTSASFSQALRFEPIT